MHAEYFMNNVKMNDYVKDSEECKPVIINALKAMYDLNMNGLSNSDFTNPLRPRLPYAILFAIGGWRWEPHHHWGIRMLGQTDGWMSLVRKKVLVPTMGQPYLKAQGLYHWGFDSVDYFPNSVVKLWLQSRKPAPGGPNALQAANASVTVLCTLSTPWEALMAMCVSTLLNVMSQRPTSGHSLPPWLSRGADAVPQRSWKGETPGEGITLCFWDGKQKWWRHSPCNTNPFIQRPSGLCNYLYY